jgi:drug/metabolite transporter (DMT)-like permease
VTSRASTRGLVDALLAAALFGATAPVAKLLLGGAGPLLLGGLLYLGAGLGLILAAALRPPSPEAALRRADAATLGAMIVAGGVLGPALMLAGLVRLSATAGALLLNLEAPATILLAVVFFGEHLARLEAAGAALIVAGAAALGLRPGEVSADPAGVLLIAGACAAWGLDNNLAARLTLRDPVAVARAKALGAGAALLALAFATGAAPPAPTLALAALGVGALGYGASLVFAYRAARALGAARQSALFASAPFLGAALAVPLLGERPALADLAAAAAMLAGVVLLARARHSHRHTHEPLEHEHLHEHDEHHAHAHGGPAHSHAHTHEPLEHEHAHASDLHHHHRHVDEPPAPR